MSTPPPVPETTPSPVDTHYLHLQWMLYGAELSLRTGYELYRRGAMRSDVLRHIVDAHSSARAAWPVTAPLPEWFSPETAYTELPVSNQLRWVCSRDKFDMANVVQIFGVPAARKGPTDVA